MGSEAIGGECGCGKVEACRRLICWRRNGRFFGRGCRRTEARRFRFGSVSKEREDLLRDVRLYIKGKNASGPKVSYTFPVRPENEESRVIW